MPGSEKRIRIKITGAVQGVGFRPHVYRLATRLGLSGFVANGPAGVLIEAQGLGEGLEEFAESLRSAPPAHALVHRFDETSVALGAADGFRIAASEEVGEAEAFLLPDLAPCVECLAELFEPGNRRYGYPFTNCTLCGPRYSIVESLPYDRPRTTMREFPMCAACEAEYRDPGSRRFHAQTNCCPACGPRLSIEFEKAVESLKQGLIVAVKGVGGFLLMCDARNEEAVRRLREKKRRPRKPLALLVGSLEDAAGLCEVSDLAGELLASPAAPIVLLRRRDNATVSRLIAPENPLLGVMLPSSPLHAMLARAFDGPLVATSGNLADEPIAIDNEEAVGRLGGIADLFLAHDRAIRRPVDDSVMRIAGGKPLLLRRARGLAPLPLESPWDLEEALATGAHMKNTVAFSRGRLVFVSQHLGDLDLLPGVENHRRALEDFQAIYSVKPGHVACDLHPGYGSTRSAESLGLPVRRVQHHEAHAWAALLEAGWKEPCAVAAWDGTGDGGDSTVWGGEFFLFDGVKMNRTASLRSFRLPGGEAAVRDPRRSLLGVLYALGEPERAAALFPAPEYGLLLKLLASGLNSPATSSAGRLFDAMAAAHGIVNCSFEGEAAMRLEAVAAGEADSGPQEALPLRHGVYDWAPLLAMPVASPRGFHAVLAGDCGGFRAAPGDEAACAVRGVLSERPAG